MSSINKNKTNKQRLKKRGLTKGKIKLAGIKAAKN